MQWQKLSNVNPPPNQILMVYGKGYKDKSFVIFARRFTNEEGEDAIEHSDDYETLAHNPIECWEDSFEAFKEMSPNAYWCVFHEPEGN